MNNFLCGACSEIFNSENELEIHLIECPAKKVLLSLIHRNLIINDEAGHPIGRLINLCFKYYDLINRYCLAIVDDIQSHDRAKIHYLLCEKLNLDYNYFKSFENPNITKMLSLKEAKEFFLVRD